MAITRILKYVAVFLDDEGNEVGQKSFKPTEKSFKFKGGSYNIVIDKATFTTVNRWYWDVQQYYYNINDPMPLILNKKCEPVIDAKIYNAVLETDFAKKIAALSRGIKLDFKMILIIIAVIAGIYLMSTGKLFPH